MDQVNRLLTLKSKMLDIADDIDRFLDEFHSSRLRCGVCDNENRRSDLNQCEGYFCMSGKPFCPNCHESCSVCRKRLCEHCKPLACVVCYHCEGMPPDCGN